MLIKKNTKQVRYIKSTSMHEHQGGFYANSNGDFVSLENHENIEIISVERLPLGICGATRDRVVAKVPSDFFFFFAKEQPTENGTSVELAFDNASERTKVNEVVQKHLAVEKVTHLEISFKNLFSEEAQ